MVQYIDPDQFPPYDPNKPQKGESIKARGYPTDWKKPHWFGDNQEGGQVYNPHLRVLFNNPDGTREWYDPTTGTHSYEHSSGYHHMIGQDSVVENVPGKKVSFVGGGGHVETISGHHDITRGGHYRENNQGDTYTNTKGVSHSFSGGGSVAVNMGNHTTENYGNHKTRLMGANSAWGVGVGPGDGNNHDNAIAMTSKRIYIRANSQGDLIIETNANNITINSGKDAIVNAKGNITTTSQKDTTVNSQGKINLNSQGDTNIIAQGDINMKATGKMNLNGNPINLNGGGPELPPHTVPGATS